MLREKRNQKNLPPILVVDRSPLLEVKSKNRTPLAFLEERRYDANGLYHNQETRNLYQFSLCKCNSGVTSFTGVISPVVGRICHFPVNLQKWGPFFPQNKVNDKGSENKVKTSG